jgi:hypothetical protein
MSLSNIAGTPYPLPKDVTITMFDRVRNRFYYYIVTSDDEANGKYKYEFADFYEMGSTNSRFKEQDAKDEYYHVTQDVVFENFIFQVDFKMANIQTDIEENLLLVELQDQSSNTLVNVLGIQRESTNYSVYADADSKINIYGNINPNPIYLGQESNLALQTNYTRSVVNSRLVFNSNSFRNKMGINLSIVDNSGNILTGDDLLGVKFSLNGTNYYPRMDGTIRIQVADKLSQILSNITIDTSNNQTIVTGNYRIRIEAFGSPDGLYYGLIQPDRAEIPVNIINVNYGLKVETKDEAKIIDSETGEALDSASSLEVKLNYNAILSNPNVTVSLERRSYDTIFATNYELVDLRDYVTNILAEALKENEYKTIDTLEAVNTISFNLREKLVTGTYRLVFKLYDGDNYIGEAYEFIIIR